MIVSPSCATAGKLTSNSERMKNSFFIWITCLIDPPDSSIRNLNCKKKRASLYCLHFHGLRPSHCPKK